MYLPRMVLKAPQSWPRTRNGVWGPSAGWSRTRSGRGVRGESEAASGTRVRGESRCGSGSRAEVRSLSHSQRGW
jgi:hypothetical protein